MKRVAIYLRVSTSRQDTENQLRELTAVADRSGWEIWKVYEDAGISGAKGRDKRPGHKICLELRSLPSTGVTRLPRYYEPLRHPRAPSLSLTGGRRPVE